MGVYDTHRPFSLANTRTGQPGSGPWQSVPVNGLPGMSPLETGLFLALLVALILLQRSSRATTRHLPLGDGQHARPLAAILLEPFLELILVAVVLRDELTEGSAHWVVASLGAVIGVAVGVVRARNVYVRAEPRYHVVILRDTRAETIALVALLALDIGSQVINQSSEWLSLFVTAALAFLVVNSVTVAAEVTRRYRQE